MEAALSEPLFTSRTRLLSRPDGSLLYGKLEVDIFCASEMSYPNIKNSLRLIRAIPNFYMNSDDHKFSFGIDDCSHYTRRILLHDDYHKKQMDKLAYTLVELNYLETLAKTFVIATRQNQFIGGNTSNNDSIRRIAFAMSTTSAFTGS